MRYNKIEILPGSRWGQVVILKEQPLGDRSAHGFRVFDVLCDCGAEFPASSQTLTRNNYEPKCRNCNYKSREIYGSYGEINDCYMKKVFASAKARDFQVQIDCQDLDNQWLLQEGLCALSGVPLKLKTMTRDTSFTASIDRIDSSLGYLVGNIQWVHRHLNLMKSNHTSEYFYNLCFQVTDYQRSQNAK